MKVMEAILVYAVMVAIFTETTQSKTWRGLEPLHSTREDVEKLLGPPSPPPTDGSKIYKPSKQRSIYLLDDEEVYIVYAEKGATGNEPCVQAVPTNTVLLIQVTPKKSLRLSDLGIDEKSFKRFDPASAPNSGYEGFVNEKEGISIRTKEGNIQIINYFAKEEDRKLCPTYYSSSKWFCSVLVH